MATAAKLWWCLDEGCVEVEDPFRTQDALSAHTASVHGGTALHNTPASEGAAGAWWCLHCNLQMQSLSAYQSHLHGRKHCRKAGIPCARDDHARRACTLTEETLWLNVAAGKYRSVVVISGAGISTACGIADFRSDGGMYQILRRTFGERFPRVL